MLFNKIYGVQILVEVDNKFLILKRSSEDKKAPNQWNLPGGKFEKGESWMEAAKRELFEEAGIDLEDFILLESSFRPFVKKSAFFQSHLIYVKGIDSISLNHEHSEYVWISLDEFDTYNVLCYSKDEIKEYLSILN